MKKIRIIAIRVLLPVFFCCLNACQPDTTTSNSSRQVSFEIFPNSSGWGYNILIDHKTFIHQPYIPVVKDLRPFPTKSIATKAAKIVVNRMINKRNPALTYHDLEKINCLQNLQKQ